MALFITWILITIGLVLSATEADRKSKASSFFFTFVFLLFWFFILNEMIK